MVRILVGVLALLIAHVGADFKEFKVTPKQVADPTFLQRQIDLYKLYTHINEPIYDKELKSIAETWDLERNIEKFENVTAGKLYLKLKEYDMLLPRSVPFNILEPRQQFEAVTLFNFWHSAKDYETLYKTAVYLRNRINEGLFVYVLSVVIMHYPETQGIVIPPIYDVFPSYFHNAEIMYIAQRVNTHGQKFVKRYPQTYIWEDNVVIKWNTTLWPYLDGNYAPVSYYLNDYALNTLHYNNHLTYPFWMSGKNNPLLKFRRGEIFWFINKQFTNRYYLERLSNGLDEIPEVNFDLVPEGYSSGLVHYNGVPLPVRPDYFYLSQPRLIKYIEKVQILERRIRDAIEIGYLVNVKGEKINLRTPDAIDVLGKVIEGNVDSPNILYYGSILTAWKELLGNSIMTKYKYWNGQVPLVLPSALELYQTALREPAFYMIWKRIQKLFTLWQSYLPVYMPEELAFPVNIQKVEVDKLVTYFEYTYLNVTNALPMNEFESKVRADEVSVLVQRPQLNHKLFKVRVHVKSDAPKTVVVKFFLAPKYDSKGYEIPLHENTQNFFQFDQFLYDLPQGESVIQRDSNGNTYMIDKWMSGYDIYRKAHNALHGNGQFVIDHSNFFDGFPRRLMLPKGRVGGMPFKFLVFINEFHAPQAPFGKGVNPENTCGIGTGAFRMTAYSLHFPLDRPLHEWQIKKLTNLRIQEVQIFHKATPEIIVPYSMSV